MTPTKPLPRPFHVHVGFDVTVLATDVRDAEDYVSTHARDFDAEIMDAVTYAHEATRKNTDADLCACLPYLTNKITNPEHKKDITIGQWFDRLDEETALAQKEALGASQPKLPGVK